MGFIRKNKCTSFAERCSHYPALFIRRPSLSLSSLTKSSCQSSTGTEVLYTAGSLGSWNLGCSHHSCRDGLCRFGNEKRDVGG